MENMNLFYFVFCSLYILKYLSPSCTAKIWFCWKWSRVAPTLFPFFLFTNTSLKTEISSIYKSLLCRFLDIFYITRLGVSQRVIPLNATPGICSAKGYHSENVMLFQNLVPLRNEKISVDLRMRELWCCSVNVAIPIWTTTTPAV